MPGLSLSDLVVGGRFVRRLPGVLRHRLSLEEARAAVRDRLGHRQRTFLDLLRGAVYGRRESPYRRLLEHAGCEYGDLERLVARDGVEGALGVLHRHGAYLTVEEFKGRRPVVRGTLRLEVDPARLRNPWSELHVPARTSGSRGDGTPVLIDLAFIRDCAADTLLGLHARGGDDWLKAHWQVPGGGAIARLVEFGSFGAPPVRWFSQVDPGAPGLPSRYRWSARAMRWGSVLAGRPLPPPVHVPLDDPLPAARWMRAVLDRHRTPHLFTFVSSAVRLCHAAAESGLSLKGAQLTVVGEPLTRARLEAIRRSGAEAVPRYAIMECSVIGQGCLAAEVPDEVHLLRDLHAVVQPAPGSHGPGLPDGALLLTSLRPTAPFILLNVWMGDRAVLTTRPCGCPLERLGWTTRAHTIRSHEKLTAGGMTFLDGDVVRVLEDVLPARFGGGPTDYQLLEEEDENGHARVRLLVHPAVGDVDPREVADTFRSTLALPDGAARVMTLLWRDAGFPVVERRPPLATTSGKILHLHSARPSA